MQRSTYTALAACALAVCAAPAAMAAAVVLEVPGAAITIDGQTTVVNAQRQFNEREKLVYVIEGYSDVERGVQRVDTFMDPDPIITAAIGVLDFGGASNFNFFWSLPIVPTIGPVTLKLTLGGSCTDNNNNGCSVTPNLASGFFADGLLDGAVLVSGGSLFSGPAGGSGSFSSSVFTVNLPAGPYNNLGLDLGFLASGGGDAVSFTLSVEVVNAVPEPSGLALAGLALGAAGLGMRRRKA
jgi:hypothetical protein